MIKKQHLSIAILAAIICICLYGCHRQKETKDIQKFIAAAKTEKSNSIEPLPKFLLPQKKEKTENSSIKARSSRNIIFHQYELSNLTLIGCLLSESGQSALISSPNDEAAVIKIGSKLGSNAARVIKISETYIQLAEPNDKSNKKITLFLRPAAH